MKINLKDSEVSALAADFSACFAGFFDYSAASDLGVAADCRCYVDVEQVVVGSRFFDYFADCRCWAIAGRCLAVGCHSLAVSFSSFSCFGRNE